MPDHDRPRRGAGRLLVCLLALVPALASAQPAALASLGFHESLDGDPVLHSALALTKAAARPPFTVVIAVPRGEIERQPGGFDFAALDQRLALYRSTAGAEILLDLRANAADVAGVTAWGRYVREVAARYATAVRGYVIRADAEVGGPRDAGFVLKSAAVNIKAADDDAVVIFGAFAAADMARLSALFDDDLGAYADAFGVSADVLTAGLPAVIEKRDAGATVLLLDEPLGREVPAAAARMLSRHLELLGTRVSGAVYVASAAVAAGALAPVGPLSYLFSQPVTSLDLQALHVTLMRSGQDVTAAVPHQLLFGLKTGASYFVYAASEGPLELRLTERSGSRPVVADGLSGTRQPVTTFSYDATSATARVVLPAATTPLVVDWSDGTDSALLDNQEVSSNRLPSVAEIVARNQQAQTVQDELLHNYVADALMAQSFRATAADPGFDVVTENRFFAEGKAVEWEERSFRLNGTKWGANRPPFPLLQAEKVMSLPLDLRLGADYRYRLDGVDEVDGRPCFVLRFEPLDAAQSLYRGTVWIDRTTFLRVKVQTVQTKLSTPVLSSEEIQHFSTAGVIEGRDIQLLTRLVARQTMLVAGRSLAVEREIQFAAFQLNAPEFAAMRQESRGSDHVMYRDTDQGLRYLVKKDGERVVSDTTTTKAKALALGVTYDPSFDFPIPLGGINYLDFDFLGKDSQLAVIFGGVVALVNVQHPKLIGERIDASLDLFAIAVRGNDRTYGDGGEQPGERLVSLPFSTGLNVGWQMTQFQRVSANYQFRYDHFSRDQLTAPAFVAPVSTATNGVGLIWDWKRAGFSWVVGATGFRRLSWQPWGNPGDYDPAQRDYVKYSASVTKDYLFGIHKIHLNTAYYGGRDLDRFSKYQFGFFDDNRIHGVPASGVRFADLGMFRGSYSFNLFEQYRLDLYVDQAIGRDRAVAPGWQSVTGLGVGFNMRGPRGTMLRGDFGKSLLPSRYREPGSVVFQVQVLKPL
ncbi:MAG: sigma-E factor regulatory protein RseB domain-containing protein [Acidobacteriota bacterium]